MFNPITFSDKVQAGDKLQFTFNFYDAILRPSSDSLIQALEIIPDFNVISADYNFLSGNIIGSSGIIIGTVANTGGFSTGVTSPQSIADDIRFQLSSFPSVYGTQITSVSKETGSVGSIIKSILGVDPTTAPSASTTISLAAIAIIAIVILVVFLKLD